MYKASQCREESVGNRGKATMEFVVAIEIHGEHGKQLTAEIRQQ